MDDESLYGKELHVITFSEAVKRGLLVDYKVIVLAVEEAHVSRRLQTCLKMKTISSRSMTRQRLLAVGRRYPNRG